MAVVYPTVEWKDPKELDERIPVTDCDLKVFSECGFNLVFGNPNKWLFPTVSNVPNISFCPEMPGTTNSDVNVFLNNLKTYRVIDYVKTNPNTGKDETIPRNKKFSMLGFQDEPTIGALEKISANYKKVRDLNIPQLPYLCVAVNATPSDPIPDGTAAKLEKYLDEIQEMLLPAMWCYDYYPIQCNFKLSSSNYSDFKDEGAQKDLLNITSLVPSSDIFVNRLTFLWLEIFKQQATNTQRPFWYVGLSREFQSLICKDKDNNDNEKPLYILRRYVSEIYMRFTAFSALAYGAKGLVYWAYTANMNVSKGKTYFFNAPFCLDDKYPNKARPTEIWGELKTVNEEVQSLKHIFLNSENHEVYHTGSYCYNNSSNRVWEGTTPFPDSKGPVGRLSSGEMGVLVSFFKSESKNYLMFVNHDIHNTQQIKIIWTQGYFVSKVEASSRKADKEGSNTLSDSGERLDTTVPINPPTLYTLQPGGYLIFAYVRSIIT